MIPHNLNTRGHVLVQGRPALKNTGAPLVHQETVDVPCQRRCGRNATVPVELDGRYEEVLGRWMYWWAIAGDWQPMAVRCGECEGKGART